MIYRKKCSTSVLMVASVLAGVYTARAAKYELASPDGLTIVKVCDEEGEPKYSVSYDGEMLVLPSPLGLTGNLGDYGAGLSVMESDEPVRVTDSYSLPNIKKSHVDYVANRRSLTLGRDGQKMIDVIFEVSDNNVAFRYKILPQGGTRCCVITDEHTGFRFPDGTTTFTCPMSKPMEGFARTYPSYETPYVPDDSVGKNGEGFGYTFPALFHIGDKGWALVSETGLAGNYCGAHLAGNADGSYTVAYPSPDEMNGFGSASAALALPGYTPWRTITVGRDLAPIVETTVAQDLVRPLYEPSQHYDYGKGTWSWIMKMDPSCNFDEQKRYIDFAAAMGYQTVLVDALWDTQIGYDRIEELARYGKTKDVSLFLWYNSNGYWNDAPQGPRGVMDDIVRRRKDMAWMKSNGVRGIKVDFFGGDKQEMMRLYHDILADANDYGLMVIFHGCTLPRGWERMYPNYVASEAVLASENLHFKQHYCDSEAYNACLHPFIRNAVGSMDFGGSALNKFYSAGNGPKGSRRMTSDVFALATAVLFQSPVQHFALAPNNLDDAPDWALDFMKAVPTTWDETRFIDGYPGRYVVLARRNGDNWYLAAINAEEKTLRLDVELPEAMHGRRLAVYSDNPDLVGSLHTAKADKKGRVRLTVPCNGAALVTTLLPDAG